MKIAMIGTGYVGLVTGACFSNSGNHVTCVDIDEAKIEGLRRGEIPIYEPGLSEMVLHNVEAKRLLFTTDLSSAVKSAELVYVAVGTPSAHDGSADMSALNSVVDQIAPHLRKDAVVVIKSTVPVGTNRRTYARLKELTGRDVDVASNPEFLKEGAAINDFTAPDRVVVGVRRDEVGETLRALYSPFLRTDKPFLVMSPESAELTKYVANALLATKISFINEMANVCQRHGGDINEVRRGIGHDQRIGFAFLFPGVGYGGSCFPKDVRALASMARACGVEPRMLEAVDIVNEAQKNVLIQMIRQHFEGQSVRDRKFAIWGLAFKPKTDDIREAPSLVLIKWLLDEGAEVHLHDPEAMENVKQELAGRSGVYFHSVGLDAIRGADALAINTEWSEYRNPDFGELKQLMATPLIFDGRNLYDPQTLHRLGFTYHSIGRQPV